MNKVVMDRMHVRPLAARLAVAVFAIGFGQSAFIALVPLIAAQTGLGTAQIGVAAAAGALAFVVGAPLWGWLGGRFGHGPILRMLGIVVLAGQAILAGLVWAGPLAPLPGFAVLAGSRLVYGLGASGVAPVAQGWIVKVASRGEQRAMLARLSAGLGAGRILGSAAAMTAGLAAQFPFLLLVLSPASLLFVPRDKAVRPAEHDDGGGRLSPFDRRMAPFLAIGFCLTTGFGQVQMMLGPLLQAKLEIPAASAASATGLVLALVAGAMILVQIVAIPRLQLDHKSSVALGAGLVALGAVIVAVSGGLALCAAGLVTGGTGVALASPGYLAWLVSRLRPAEQGAAAGWLASAHVLGQGGGAFLGGYAFALWPLLPLVLCALLAVLVAVAALAMKTSKD